MAVYNCAAYLPAALDSVLAQTFGDFELVVVDDASTDETASILRAYVQRDARFVLLRNDSNLKLPTSLNRGLAACRAPLVARADGDDLYEPARLEKQFGFLREHSRAGVVSCYYRTMDSGGQRLEAKKLPVTDSTIKFNLLWESALCHPAAMYRRDTVQSIGGYDTTYPTAQDYDLWARLRDLTEFANLPEPLITLRIHAASSSALRGSEQSRLACGVSKRLLTRYLGRALTDDEAAALRSLLCAYDSLGPDKLHAALGLLDELLCQARARESTATLQWAKRTIASSLLKEAYYRTYQDPRGSWKLLRKTAEVSLRQAICLPAALQVLRLLVAKRRKRTPLPA